MRRITVRRTGVGEKNRLWGEEEREGKDREGDGKEGDARGREKT